MPHNEDVRANRKNEYHQYFRILYRSALLRSIQHLLCVRLPFEQYSHSAHTREIALKLSRSLARVCSLVLGFGIACVRSSNTEPRATQQKPPSHPTNTTHRRHRIRVSRNARGRFGSSIGGWLALCVVLCAVVVGLLVAQSSLRFGGCHTAQRTASHHASLCAFGTVSCVCFVLRRARACHAN